MSKAPRHAAWSLDRLSSVISRTGLFKRHSAKRATLSFTQSKLCFTLLIKFDFQSVLMPQIIHYVLYTVAGLLLVWCNWRNCDWQALFTESKYFGATVIKSGDATQVRVKQGTHSKVCTYFITCDGTLSGSWHVVILYYELTIIVMTNPCDISEQTKTALKKSEVMVGVRDRVYGGHVGTYRFQLLDRGGHNIVCPPQYFVIKIL